MTVAARGTKQRSALGRGLSALISTPISIAKPVVNPVSAVPTEPVNKAPVETPSAAPGSTPGIVFVGIEKLHGNPAQPRQEFKEEELKELSESIRALGVIQPILVRNEAATQTYVIIAGERRWRAAKLAGLTEVPVIVRDVADREALEIALVENIQRSNLNPIEEALAYERLINEFGLAQNEVAERVGKDRTSVTNHLRLLKLPEDVLAMVRQGKLSVGHAKAILAIREPSAQLSLARKTIAESLSVRALESIIARVVVLDVGKRAAIAQPASDRASLPANLVDVTDRLRNKLGTKVIINHHKSGRGRIEIEYFSEQELDRVIDQLLGQ